MTFFALADLLLGDVGPHRDFIGLGGKARAG